MIVIITNIHIVMVIIVIIIKEYFVTVEMVATVKSTGNQDLRQGTGHSSTHLSATRA